MSSTREKTDDVRDTLAEAERLRILDMNRLALGEVFESVTYRPQGVGVIEFVNVSTSIVAGTQTGT